MKRFALFALLVASTFALPAGAQNVPGDQRSVVEQRISGVWRGDRIRISASQQPSGVLEVVAWVTPLCGQNCRAEHFLKSVPTLSLDGEALEARWVDQTSTTDPQPLIGRWRLAMQGDLLQVRFLDGDPLKVDGATLQRSAPHGRPSPPAFARFTGSWTIPYGGTMTLREEYKRLIGEYRREDATGVRRVSRVFLFHPENVTSVEAPGDTIVGMWQAAGAGRYEGGKAELTLTNGGVMFGGKLFDDPAHAVWKGTRQGGGVPAAEPAPPTPPAQTPPTPLPPQTPPAEPPATPPATPPTPAPGAFKPLRRFDVRLDRLVEARGYPTRQVHAFVTVRNVSGQPQYATSGFLKALLTDSDGVAQERSQVWRASGEPAALFSGTPVIQPGAELTIRYVFIPDDGAQLATLTLFEADQRAEFPARF